MNRPLRLGFACLACFLILLPLSLKKPGLPMQLGGDEATYLAMAASLVHDLDLRCDRADVDRLFAWFPYAEVSLELATDDDWATARFARPLIYPLLAAPFTALWGANGAITLNAALFLLALLVAWRYLRRASSDGIALIFALGFFLFSAAFSYLFRIQPQIMIMAAVTVAMVLGWRAPRDSDGPPEMNKYLGGGRRWWLSGAALGVAMLQEPVLAMLVLPLAGGRFLQAETQTTPQSRWRALAGWLAGCGVVVATLALLSISLGGEVWPDHLGHPDTAAEFTLKSPLELPWQDAEALEAARQIETGARRSVIDLLEDSFLFVWGRRSGVLPYFPLVLPILLIFGAGVGRARRGGGERMDLEWLLLATLSALGVLQVLAEPVSRALHQLQIGNPHMVGIYPAFLFLVPRLPRPLVIASYGLGTLVLGSLLSISLGIVVPGAGIHAHTRNLPLSLLPFEYPALGRAPGFHRLELHGLGTGSPADDALARLWAPADQAEIRGDELWLLGGESVELWLESRAPVPSAVFQLRNQASGNRVSIRLAGQKEARDFEQMPAAGQSFRLELEPENPDKVRRDFGGAIYYYRLGIKTRAGERPTWRQGAGKDYLGVAVAFLGTRDFLDRELYATEWLACGVPPRVAPGEEFLAAGRLRNLSDHGWPHLGPARVRLSYRWLDAGGQEIPHASLRTDLPGTVKPGSEHASWLSIVAPRDPGSYVLELDPLFENVAWFSNKVAGATCRADIEVSQ